MEIYNEIKCLKGVGPKTRENLNKCGIYTIMDLLLYFPRQYNNVEVCNELDGVSKNQEIITKGKVINIGRDIRTKRGKVLSQITFANENMDFKCKWFNQPYIKNYFKINNEYVMKGKVDYFNGERMIMNPKIIKNNEINLDNTEEKVIPIYSLKGKIKMNTIMKLVSEVLNDVKIEENLPKWIIDKNHFCSLDFAIRNIHNPTNYKALCSAKKRLKYQEMFTYSLKILMLKKYKKVNYQGIGFKISKELVKLKNGLPYKLTDAQNKVIREILIDEKKSIPMNRLVQGDVGSGKTIVAIIAIFNVVKNGYQAAFMAPTEILAKQHYSEVRNILKDFNFNIKVLSGSTTLKEKEQIKKDLEDGKIDILIGTHALIEDDVKFKKLGFIITDEQHRFGVMQRNKLFTKGKNIDVLVMTATPIPRTLSLYLYGDLNVSIIDKLPPGRKKIDTYYIKKEQKDRVYKFALKQIREGKQAYVVCPLVEENSDLKLTSVEKLYDELKNKYFKDINIAILHGKMSNKDKNEIMEKFKNNEIKVLIATTVIEVGINVPNATLIIIENAERFGLAQLHQLRGRVGRGGSKSYCILIANVKNAVTKKRMNTMVENSDGFYIAEQDLKIRGGGEIFGIRQHGSEGLILCDLVEDIDILKKCNVDLQKLLQSNNKEDLKIIEYTENKLNNSTRYICFN